MSKKDQPVVAPEELNEEEEESDEYEDIEVHIVPPLFVYPLTPTLHVHPYTCCLPLRPLIPKFNRKKTTEGITKGMMVRVRKMTTRNRSRIL